MDEQRDWHRWFGLAWKNQMTGQPYRVEVEMDLSLNQQFLDVAILRLVEDGPLTVELPDGFDDLRRHNVISFKSFQEAFDLDALYELLGHALNYRKQAGTKDAWVPRAEVGLFGVSVRYPKDLAGEVKLHPIADGVYDVAALAEDKVRLVVVHQLPKTKRNAMLHAFSYREDLARFGCANLEIRSPDMSSFLVQLLRRYRNEGFNMPFTVKQFNRETLPIILGEMDEDELMEIVPVERVLKAVTVEQMLAALSPEMREALRQKFQADAPKSPPT